MEKYDQYLKANGLFDFDDMIEFAIHYPRKTDRGFRLSLSELFQYILLDEFQDTNPFAIRANQVADRLRKASRYGGRRQMTRLFMNSRVRTPPT